MASGYKGKIGVIIITLALVSSVFIGYAINVTTSTTTETQYDYVTDVSGLFNYDQTPTYVDYDVSKNYNGYSEYTSNTTYSTTDTYTNTAVSGETWYKGTTYSGTLPCDSEYKLYLNNGYMHINGSTVTYTVSGETTTYSDVTSVVINSSNIIINNATSNVISCDPSSIIYQYVSGYDVLGTGTTTLYKLTDGSTFYFKSTNKVYQIENDILTEITTSSTGITAYGDGYTGTADNTYIDSLSVIINVTSVVNTDRTNTGTIDAKIGMTTKSVTSSTILSSISSATSYIYHSGGAVSFLKVASTVKIVARDSNGDTIKDISVPSSTTIVISLSDSGVISSTYGALSITITDPSTAICDNYSLATTLGFSTDMYSLDDNTTYYYNSTINTYSFQGNRLKSGVFGSTARNNIYTGTVESNEPIFVSGLTVRETGTITTPTTYTNTRATDNATLQLGITPTKTIGNISSYELYSGNYHINWNNDIVTVIESGTTDTVTLTTAMTISNDTLTITGTSTRYDGSHTYTISLTGNTAIKHISGNAILTGGTSLNKLSGTVYYKSSSNTYGYISNSVTTSLGGTSIGHGVYSLSVGNTPIWTSDSLSVVSDSYTAYDMTQLVPTSNIGLTYYTTDKPNAYIVGSVASSGSGSKSLKDNSYTELTVPNYTYGLISRISTTYGTESAYQYNYYLFQNGVTLTNYVASLGLPANTNTIVLTYKIGYVTSTEMYNYIYFGSKTVSDTGDVPSDTYFQHLITGYTQPMSDLDTSSGNKTYSITYNVQTNSITNLSWYGDVNLSGSDYALYYNATTYGDTGSYRIVGQYYNKNDGSYIAYVPSTASSQTSSISYSYAYSTPTYMDVNKGVKINASNSHSVVRWNNGYTDNGLVSIVFHADQNGTSYTNSLKLSTGHTITVTRGTDLHTYVAIGNNDAIDVGVWSSFLLTINAQSGTVTVNPIDIFFNYTSITLYDYTYVIGSIGGNQSISYIDYNYTSSSFGITVYKTHVFLNTYGSVMKNPSINVSNYFSDIEDLRLNFRSFAIYGNTITINGITFYGDAGTGNIIDTGKIYYGGKSYVMQDMYVTYNDDKTYLTFNDDGVTLDLGDTTTKNISMSGYWYFTTELYEGKEVTVNTYDWKPDVFAINMQGLAILFIGLTILGTVIARRFLNEDMTAIDYILIIGSIAIFGALLGGLML